MPERETASVNGVSFRRKFFPADQRLTAKVYDRCEFDEAEMGFVEFRGIFNKCSFKRVNFRNAKFYEATFKDCDFSGSDFTLAQFFGEGIRKNVFLNCNLYKCKFYGAVNLTERCTFDLGCGIIGILGATSYGNESKLGRSLVATSMDRTVSWRAGAIRRPTGPTEPSSPEKKEEEKKFEMPQVDHYRSPQIKEYLTTEDSKDSEDKKKLIDDYEDCYGADYGYWGGMYGSAWINREKIHGYGKTAYLECASLDEFLEE